MTIPSVEIHSNTNVALLIAHGVCNSLHEQDASVKRESHDPGRGSSSVELCSRLSLEYFCGRGLAVAQREGEWSRFVANLQIARRGEEQFFTYGCQILQSLRATLREWRVLLTGGVREQKEATDAARLVWQVPGVREVYNERESSGQPRSFVKSSRDLYLWLFRSAHYAIDVTRGTVSLSQNRTELQRVLTSARNLLNVTRVVCALHGRTPAGGEDFCWNQQK